MSTSLLDKVGICKEFRVVAYYILSDNRFASSIGYARHLRSIFATNQFRLHKVWLGEEYTYVVSFTINMREFYCVTNNPMCDKLTKSSPKVQLTNCPKKKVQLTKEFGNVAYWTMSDKINASHIVKIGDGFSKLLLLIDCIRCTIEPLCKIHTILKKFRHLSRYFNSTLACIPRG